jgi:hypothetical protein
MMNDAFQKFNFPQSNPKKIIILRVTNKDRNLQKGVQLQINFVEEDFNKKGKEV